MATAVTEDLVSKLGELSATDLLALKELLGVGQPQQAQQPQRRFDPEANLAPDKPLAEPVKFWNARYPEEHIRIPGRTSACQFWAGTFLAKTERELAAARGMGAHVYEGDDRETPLECPVCKTKSWNERHYQEHVGSHAK